MTTTTTTTTMTMTMTTTMTDPTADATSGAPADAIEGEMAREPAADAPRTGRRSLGIRARIVVGYVALLAAALAISAIVTRQVSMARLDREVDRSLSQEIDELQRLATGTDPATGEPFGENVAAIFDTFLTRSVPADVEAFYTFVGGEPYLRSFGAPADLFRDPYLLVAWTTSAEPRIATDNTTAGRTRSLAVPMMSGSEVLGTFVVVYFPQSQRDEINQNMRIVALAGAIVIVASAFVAWSLAGRVLRPVRELTSTAQAISETDLSARIPVEGGDELAELGHTFNEMLDRVESGFEQQRRFLDDVAHELRTPITIAQGHLDLLGDDPADREETVAVVTDELERMSRYVTDLLLLAKSERPDFLRLEPIDLGEFAPATLRKLTALADREWVLDEAPDAGTTVIEGDPGRLEQAMLNLATNAVQHTRAGDVIALGASVDPWREPSARLWVRDTGTGIDAKAAAELFKRAARGATSRTARPDGMGIGLTIVDAIVRAHRGRIDVEGHPGGGARFEITIPIHPPLSPSPTSQPEENANP